MAELNEFDVKLAEAIQNSGATKGAGATPDEMLDALGLESTEENIKRLGESLRKMQKTQYIYKIAAVHPGMPDEYFTTQKYWQERETYWMGARFGKKVTRVPGVPDDNPPIEQ